MLTEVIMIIIGVGFVAVGLLIRKKQMISLIHSYHFKRVRQEDKKPYTKLMGIGVELIGAGCILTGVINFVTASELGFIGFAVFFTAGFVFITIAQRKYNDGFF